MITQTEPSEPVLSIKKEEEEIPLKQPEQRSAVEMITQTEPSEPVLSVKKEEEEIVPLPEAYTSKEKKILEKWLDMLDGDEFPPDYDSKSKNTYEKLLYDIHKYGYPEWKPSKGKILPPEPVSQNILEIKETKKNPPSILEPPKPQTTILQAEEPPPPITQAEEPLQMGFSGLSEPSIQLPSNEEEINKLITEIQQTKMTNQKILQAVEPPPTILTPIAQPTTQIQATVLPPITQAEAIDEAQVIMKTPAEQTREKWEELQQSGGPLEGIIRTKSNPKVGGKPLHKSSAEWLADIQSIPEFKDWKPTKPIGRIPSGPKPKK